MANVFITRAIPGDAADTLRQAGHQVTIWPGALPPPPGDLAAALATADAAMTMVTDRVTADRIAASPRLRILANMAVGYDNISPADAELHGVWLTNTPGVLAETTADFAWSIMLSAARNIALSDRDTRAGGWKTWSPTAFLGVDLFRATLGIIGMGEIGRAVARRARGFEMTVLYTSRSAQPAMERDFGCVRVELDELLARSDFVSVHLPLTPETRQYLRAEHFARMKPGSILVNTARGGVIDQDALINALRSGPIGGAALDVTDPEPLPLDNPLYSFPNVVITPHIASASLATRSRMAAMAASNIIEVLANRPPVNPVNRPAHPRGAATR